MNQLYDTSIIIPLDTPFKLNIIKEAKDMRMSVAALVRMKMSYCNKKYQKNDNMLEGGREKIEKTIRLNAEEGGER